MNVKALYRRGQAYKQLGKLELVVAYLRKAVEVSPHDETIAQALREISMELMEKGSIQEDQNGFFKDRFQATNVTNEEMYGESLRNLSKNPDILRTMQSLMENVNPESLSALSGGKLTPDMVKTVSVMFSRMSPEELQNMMKMSSTLPRQNQASSSTFNDTRNRHSVMGSSQSVSVDNGLFEEN